MQRESSRPVRTFSIGFAEDAYNEAHHAKAVARHLGTDHTELYVSPQQALDVIPRLPDIYDEPFADSSQIPTFLVSQLARRDVTVSLSGDGGDELFGGYNRYVLRTAPVGPARRRSACAAFGAGRWLARCERADVGGAARRAAACRTRALSGRAPGREAAQARGRAGATHPEAPYLRLVSQWNDPLGIVPGTEEPRPCCRRRRRRCRPSTIRRAMMFLDLVTYLPDDILVKVDRAAMAVSLETRVPLLDHRVVEFAWQLPTVLKMNGDATKRVLRRVLHRHVPPALIERPKMGFGVPIDHWLRGPLKDWARAPARSGAAERAGLLRAAPDHSELATSTSPVSANWQYPLWDVLMFQAWLERWHGE